MNRNPSKRHPLYPWSVRHPILVAFLLLAIAVLLRIVDIMVLPLAERWGEAFLHKALGFVLVLAYVWATGQTLAAIGLHRRRVSRALLIGTTGAVLLFVLSFGVFWIAMSAAGKQPAWVVAAIDNKTGLARPGLTFALWLILGNLVNAFMEEGLFRGVMLSHFRVRLTPWQANVLQAVLFGLWHIAWPIQHLLSGRIGWGAALSQSAFILAGSTISGLAWGYLFLKTDNLWASWIAHVINNTALNLLHIRTVDGLDANVAVLYVLTAVGYLAFLLWIRLWARRLKMPTLQPWGGQEQRA